ncbi:hypothetical protein M0R72_10635 [Candidatus Pacearchaeota archaeon]|jgi:hypothetical protein|nr:hypothetical protein [Candidatus Pacearchaeota archaeon]
MNPNLLQRLHALIPRLSVADAEAVREAVLLIAKIVETGQHCDTPTGVMIAIPRAIWMQAAGYRTESAARAAAKGKT